MHAFLLVPALQRSTWTRHWQIIPLIWPGMTIKGRQPAGAKNNHHAPPIHIRQPRRPDVSIKNFSSLSTPLYPSTTTTTTTIQSHHHPTSNLHHRPDTSHGRCGQATAIITPRLLSHFLPPVRVRPWHFSAISSISRNRHHITFHHHVVEPV